MSYASKQQLEELAAYMASQINVPTIGIGGGYAPIGTIISYMGTTAPQDYLACDGSTKNIADYPQLADFFEAQFGSKNYFGGDGVTTFGVPDLQGEFLRGTGTNSHLTYSGVAEGSGGNVGEHQKGTIEVLCVGTKSGSSSSVRGTVGGYDHFDAILQEDLPVSHATASAAQTSNGTQYTSRPTNTSVLYCIKAVVAGDVYSTEERVVGTWIDGKLIYQKTINFGALPNNTEKSIAHGISNLDKILTFNGFLYSDTGAMNPLPYINNEGKFVSVYRASNNLDKITIYTNFNSSLKNSYITLQYTKTTD